MAKGNSSTKARMVTEMNVDTFERFKMVCKANERTTTSVVREMIRSYLKEHEA